MKRRTQKGHPHYSVQVSMLLIFHKTEIKSTIYFPAELWLLIYLMSWLEYQMDHRLGGMKLNSNNMLDIKTVPNVKFLFKQFCFPFLFKA